MTKRRRKIRFKNVIFLIVVLLMIVFSIYKIITHNDFKVELNHTVYYIGEKYTDDFKATYKGNDVTDKVKVAHNIYNNEIGTYQIIFTYTIENKEYKIIKEIEIKDDTVPIITLKSGKTIMIVINSEYIDPGYSAVDSYDGEITSKVKVSGEVDTKKEGTYVVKYTVHDSSGNKAMEKRKVTVTTTSPLTMSVKNFTLDGFFMNVQLQETELSNIDYQQNTIFAGDSTALYYVMNKIITGKQLWHKEGVSLETIFNQEIYINHNASGLTLIEAVEKNKPNKILLSLGTNSIATMEIDYLISKYKELLKQMKEVSPNTIIIVQSIFPVAKSLDDNNKALNNDKINKINYYLLKTCSELNIPFLNTASVLKDENGTLKSGYYRTSTNENGVHLSEEGNKVAIDYFNNHQYKN